MELGIMQEILNSKSLAFDCRLDQYHSETPGMMYVEFGYVEGPTIEEGFSGGQANAQSRFMTCLHELGHFYYGHTQGRPPTRYRNKIHHQNNYFSTRDWYFRNGVLKSEAQAWNWALNNCELSDDEILPQTRLYMAHHCLGSYLSHAFRVGFETPGQKLYNGDRAYVSFAYGTPDEFFNQVRDRLEYGT